MWDAAKGDQVSWNVGAGLEGRSVIVTGAAGGIGRAVTLAFATTGARVLATDVDQGRLDDVLLACSGDGHVALALDLNDPSARDQLVARALKEFGGIDVLAHTAAVLRRREKVDDITEDDWDAQLDTNLKTTFFLSRAIANEMASRGGGRIILFSSQGWMTGGFGGSMVYAASKGGVVSLSRGLARTFGPQGVNVNTVAPGQINTPMLHTGLDPAVYQRMSDETPLGYVGEPEDIAGVVVFLASQHARFITGATINVSGGFLMY
jgi:NAD(P)-dependent dehydrogenase (short-subunit alcohol dehydrogenase family)